jgi:AraC-like DNA-binding protein
MPHWSLPRPAASTQLMIRVAAEHQISEQVCVACTGLTEAQLRDPALEVAGQQELGVLRNIMRAVGPDVAFGLEAGLRYQATTHGMLGFALLTSATLGNAVDTIVRYFDLSYSFNRFEFEVAGREARFFYDDSDNPDDLRAVLVERDLGAAVTFGRNLFGYTVPVLYLQLRASEPRYCAAFESIFGMVPQFGAPRNCMAIDVEMLNLQNSLSDELSSRISEEQCRSLLESRKLQAGIAGRARSIILQKPGEFPDMRAVAAKLGMTTRTLRNQLTRESTSYRQLVEQTREQLAEELLTTTQLNMEQVAARLGYRDSSSFIAAFKRWKGVPPGGYLRRHGGTRC